jgi:uncharacterized protein (TIRG00374 family)
MKKRGWMVVATAAATLAIGYFVIQQLSWSELTRLWANADPKLLALAFAIYALANVLRARRFRALTGDQLSTIALLRLVFMQNFLNTFLPLRAGEVSYLYLIHRTGLVRPGENLASLIGARVLDLIAALWIPLLILPMSRVWSAEGHTAAWFAILAVGSALGMGVALLRADALGGWLSRLADRREGRVSHLLRTGGDTLNAFAQLRRGRLFGRVAGLTFACWALIYISGYTSLLGLGVQIGLWDALFAYCFPIIASMTPLYMLGGFGVFEGSIGTGLHLVGVPLGQAMSSGLLLHIAELLYVVALVPFGVRLRGGRTLVSDKP